ncbi:hypothetical protein SNE40_017142 [Patella caerulea]|uniref:Programmed cell death protein 2 C-terminal domain-containing protein n=1 Tax=Patella caerulea TaxID=87958 RepID=A0AAN8JGI6_PATCE
MTSLLGIPDETIGDGQRLSWDTNKIGGHPNWMYENCCLPVCEGCGRRMKLVVQLYCPLEGSAYHRTLYISACYSKHCYNKPYSWKVQRCQILDQSQATPQATNTVSASTDTWGVDEDDWGDPITTDPVTLDTKDWCDDADDWGEDGDDAVAMVTGNINNSNSCPETKTLPGLKFEQMNLVDVDDISDTSSSHSNDDQMSNIVQEETDDIISRESVGHVVDLLAVKSSDKAEAGISCQEVTETPFKSYYLSVMNESDIVPDNVEVGKLLKDYERETGTDTKSMVKSSSKCPGQNTGGGGAAEEYEKTAIKGDKYSHKFLKRLKLCPRQCIRYCWNDKPMFISPPRDIGVREITCTNCQAKCVFELQLMPPLVNYLKNIHGESVEFGTVIVYTCMNTCWSTNQKLPVLETCYIQPDPDQHLFKL